ncbi:related to FUN12 - general translation factor eIF2 homolog [Cephalotrichum gorgonifer]|uniref:Related to FUN12 - general translation factor eIF2 homolog n=1 Tax=Cephalotrichum gorgonifer TaxID=2041049 RepID=A0AAE8N3M9_9PEZI|nr:related to FUN12 - general translation factor eIF2 homolog [Cephalotrichum gorgonifer]
MALQASVLEDGSWVTENVTIQAVLSAREPSGAVPEESLPPECGLLTRTVIESPVVQWIFPARVRSAAHNDVAFIGDRFVQIRELGDDGQLHDIARKVDFESRIRNARVLGSFYEDSFVGDVHETTSGTFVNPPGMHLGQDPLHAPSEPKRPPLPPQLLVIVLESGQIVFLFLRKSRQGTFQFVASSVEPPRKERLVHPGFHLAIDPSSRYIVTATCEGLFVIHELEPFDTLNGQLHATGTISPIVASRSRALNGIIHKAEFLFPGSANPDTVILVLIVVRKGASRLIMYEWAHGDDLRSVLLEDVTGLKLPPEHKMPLLLIPLTVKTAFLSVSENSIAVFRDVLHGSSNPEAVNTKPLRQTEYHHGHAKPLWTAWTRPFRRKEYYESKDNIYLAREDGMIFFFEVNSDEILESSLDVGDYKTNISTAFATVADTFSDIFILGGSCGDGSIWVLHAREPPAQIGTIPNWSPALDLVTTDRFLTWNEPRGSAGPNGSAMKSWNELTLFDHTEHDRVFATSGRGVNGSITEFMSGIKANITIDVEYGSALGHVWVFSTPRGGTSAGYTVLLALHGQSAVVELTPDLAELQEHDVSEMGLDTSARTLAASQLSDGTICQVTEATIVLLGHAKRLHHTIADIVGGQDSRAENACIGASMVAFTVLSMQSTPGYEVYVVATTNPGTVLRRHVIEHEVTCLRLCAIGAGDFLVVAVWRLDQTALLFYDTNATEVELALVFPLPLPGSDEAAGDNTSPIEAVTTLVGVYQSPEKTIIVGGTRGGYFLQLEVALVEQQVEVTRFSFEKLGRLPLEVLPTTSSPTTLQNSVFLCCDSAVVLLEEYDVKGTKGFGLRNRIVPMDPGSEMAECLQVASIAKIPGGSAAEVPVLVLTGSRLLVANLEPRPGIISRRLPLGGTPLRLMYSQALRCLVVAATVRDRPTLIFMDPDTGENLSQPTDRRGGEPQEFITGLGHEGDWIHSLCEWSYTKDESTFLYILVATNSGRLLVVSAARAGGVVKFWTRHKRSIQDAPIYAVCAEADNIFFCAGSAVYWNKLDAVERRIKDYATIDLVSPATALSITGRKLYALTQAHSLEVIDLDMVEQKEDIRTVGGGLMEKRTRPASHMIDVGNVSNGSPSWPITLLSDRECGVVGAWVPKKGDGQEVTIVLEAELPASVRRFRRGHTQPPWWRSRPGQPRYGRIPSTVDDAEVLGICLDGSMQHFTLLNMDAWRFLRLIQDAATEQCRSEAGDGPEASRIILSRPSTPTLPRSQLQVNGDILQSVLANKGLEKLFGNSRNLRLFKRYLDRLDNGEWSRDFREPSPPSEMHTDDDLDEVDCEDRTVKIGGDWETMTARYLELGYDILGYFLRPVL